jgi:amidohydrolase
MIDGDNDPFEREAMIALRRDLHAHPELGFEEVRTSGIVAGMLEEAGIAVHRGFGKTGVVGTLRVGTGTRTIGLRADMDALAMPEMSDLPYKSSVSNTMHACGHDGHTVMLLAAARHLARTQAFSGTVHFIFQPAEEGRGGAKAMIEDGVLQHFPMDAVFGLHNMPGLATDEMAVVAGPQLASSDSWEVTFQGVGTHGAKPHLGRDAMTAAAHFLTAIHTIVARLVDPLQPAVVSACAIGGGDFRALNVIPDEVRIGGTARAYTPEVRDQIEAEIGNLAQGVAAMFGMSARYEFKRRIPPVVNEARATAAALAAATAVTGKPVVTDFPPSTAGDDFAEFGARLPGCSSSGLTRETFGKQRQRLWCVDGHGDLDRIAARAAAQGSGIAVIAQIHRKAEHLDTEQFWRQGQKHDARIVQRPAFLAVDEVGSEHVGRHRPSRCAAQRLDIVPARPHPPRHVERDDRSPDIGVKHDRYSLGIAGEVELRIWPRIARFVHHTTHGDELPDAGSRCGMLIDQAGNVGERPQGENIHCAGRMCEEHIRKPGRSTGTRR